VSTNYTSNSQLQKPATADRNWDVQLNANFDALDGMTAIGGLVVTPADPRSATLSVRISQGNYRKSDGSIGAFAGVSSYLLAAETATFLWLTDAGALSAGAAFPTTAHVRLASVATGTNSIISVNDQRVQCASSGSGTAFISKSGDTLADGASFTLGVTLGTQIGTLPTQRLAFFGSVPATQAARLASLSDTSGGVAGAGISDVGTSFSQSTINSNFATLTATVNALIAALKHNVSIQRSRLNNSVSGGSRSWCGKVSICL
jgi:hypothetical protein